MTALHHLILIGDSLLDASSAVTTCSSVNVRPSTTLQQSLGVTWDIQNFAFSNTCLQRTNVGSSFWDLATPADRFGFPDVLEAAQTAPPGSAVVIML